MGSDVNMGNNHKAIAIEEEIVVLEKDVILKRGEVIPSIQFLDRVYDQVDRNLQDAIVVCPSLKGNSESKDNLVHPEKVNVVEIISENNLFGPWMVVDNRHRRNFTVIEEQYNGYAGDHRNKTTCRSEARTVDHLVSMATGVAFSSHAALTIRELDSAEKKQWALKIVGVIPVKRELLLEMVIEIDVIAEHHAQQLNPTSLLRNFINVCSAYDIKGSSDSSSYFEEDMEFTDREEDMIHSER
ncbi:hypothetical protein V6N13_098400 [Hibiscus sabdariffa]